MWRQFQGIVATGELRSRRRPCSQSPCRTLPRLRSPSWRWVGFDALAECFALYNLKLFESDFMHFLILVNVGPGIKKKVVKMNGSKFHLDLASISDPARRIPDFLLSQVERGGLGFQGPVADPNTVPVNECSSCSLSASAEVAIMETGELQSRRRLCSHCPCRISPRSRSPGVG